MIETEARTRVDKVPTKATCDICKATTTRFTGGDPNWVSPPEYLTIELTMESGYAIPAYTPDYRRYDICPACFKKHFAPLLGIGRGGEEAIQR